jgi:hypothetical protein
MHDLEQPAGFWSYTHEDDRLDGGRILRLAEKLSAEFGLLTGENLELFVDRADLKWGQEWRARIDEALSRTTFFIPIITPRYFRSTECRAELLKFAGHAASLGLEQLLLPLLYIRVPALDQEDARADEAVALIKKTQWFEWRELRLADEDSSAYRQAINKLAQRLIEIRDNVADQALRSAPPAAARAEETEEGPALLERLAAMEETVPRLTASAERLGQLLEDATGITEEAGTDLQASDAAGRGFAGRLAVARRFAKALGQPAQEIADLGERYSAQLVEADPGALDLIRLTKEAERLDPASAEQAQEFFQAVRTAVKSSRESTASLTQYDSSLDKAAGWSRDLRPVVEQIKAGLRGFTDGQAVLDEWERLIDEVDPASPA